MNDPCPALRHCALCHKDFHTSDPSGQTARAEYEAMRPQYDTLGADDPTYDPHAISVVCDDCYQKVKAYYGF